MSCTIFKNLDLFTIEQLLSRHEKIKITHNKMKVFLFNCLLLIFVAKRITSRPITNNFGDSIDTQSLKTLIEKESNSFKLLDFRTSKERQIMGYITGSILVPEFLTPDNVRNNENLDLDGISYKSKEDNGKNIIFVSTKEKSKDVHQMLTILGYQHNNDIIDGYFEGLDNWKSAGGALDYPRTIHFQALNQYLKLDSPLLIDVRNRSELNSPGQIPGSVCVPLHEILHGSFELPSRDFKERYGFEKPTQSSVLVLTCRSGRRILVAENYLKSYGYQNIRVYPGSFKDWVVNRGEIVAGNYDLDYDVL